MPAAVPAGAGRYKIHLEMHLHLELRASTLPHHSSRSSLLPLPQHSLCSWWVQELDLTGTREFLTTETAEELLAPLLAPAARIAKVSGRGCRKLLLRFQRVREGLLAPRCGTCPHCSTQCALPRQAGGRAGRAGRRASSVAQPSRGRPAGPAIGWRSKWHGLTR